MLLKQLIAVHGVSAKVCNIDLAQAHTTSDISEADVWSVEGQNWLSGVQPIGVTNSVPFAVGITDSIK